MDLLEWLSQHDVETLALGRITRGAVGHAVRAVAKENPTFKRIDLGTCGDDDLFLAERLNDMIQAAKAKGL